MLLYNAGRHPLATQWWVRSDCHKKKLKKWRKETKIIQYLRVRGGSSIVSRRSGGLGSRAPIVWLARALPVHPPLENKWKQAGNSKGTRVKVGSGVEGGKTQLTRFRSIQRVCIHRGDRISWGNKHASTLKASKKSTRSNRVFYFYLFPFCYLAAQSLKDSTFLY